MKPFVYLIQSADRMPYGDLPDPACDVILLTWKAPAQVPGALFQPDSTWNEGRNHLLAEALAREEAAGERYRYLIFLDDDCLLQEDRTLARQLGLPLTGNPFRTFERFLLDWQPAVGYLRYDWQHVEDGRETNLGHNIDALCNAFHREAVPFLLPYYTGFDAESWLYSQHLINHLISLVYHPYRLQCNLVTARNARRRGYPQRRKYWSIPTAFLHAAVRSELGARMPLESPNTVIPRPEHPRRKDRSYALDADVLQRHFDTRHPFFRFRRLARPAPRRLPPNPRAAVCISGRLAGLEHTAENIQRRLLDALGAYDLFIYAPEDAHSHLAARLRPTVLRIASDRPIEEKPLENGRNCRLKSGVQGYLQQLYGLKMCNRMRLEYARDQGLRYDWVIRCRPDVLFQDPLPDFRRLDLNYLHVPDFHGYEGCNDRFAIGNSQYMTTYMEKFDDFHDYVRRWTEGRPWAPPVTAEMFTGGHLREHGVPIRLIPVRFNRVRGPRVKNDTADRPHDRPPAEAGADDRWPHDIRTAPANPTTSRSR